MGAILTERISPSGRKSTRVPASGLEEYLATVPSGALPREEHLKRVKGAVGLGYRSPYSYKISREKIREFAHSVFEEHPVYYSEGYARKNGLDELIASPTFVGVLGIVAQRPLTDGFVVGYDVSQIMQTEQRIEYFHPIFASDEMFVEVILDSFREMAGTDIITTRNEIFNQDDVHLLSSWTTCVAKVVDHENREMEEMMKGIAISERKVL